MFLLADVGKSAFLAFIFRTKVYGKTMGKYANFVLCPFVSTINESRDQICDGVLQVDVLYFDCFITSLFVFLFNFEIER